jgi:tRNA (guanine-N7-)-methyltransferase
VARNLDRLARAMPRARSCVLRRISTITPPELACAHPAFWRAQRAEDWRTPWSGWSRTKYEAKAMAEGRDPVYLTFVRALR